MTAKPETLLLLQSKNIEDDENTFTVSKALYTTTVHVRIKSLLDALSILETTYCFSKWFLKQQFIELEPPKDWSDNNTSIAFPEYNYCEYIQKDFEMRQQRSEHTECIR